MRERGRFITLEGGEGVGKSTQARRLADWLATRGVPTVLTREPGGSPRAEVLRELLLRGRVAPFGAAAEALVFALARADHLEETIRPALQSGAWVIGDRFLDSTWAYQGSAGVPPSTLAELDRIAVGADKPDLTLILDLKPEIALRRMQARGRAPDHFETVELHDHEARRGLFLAIAAREPGRCAVVDASAGEQDVAEAIRAITAARLGAFLAA